MLNLLFMYELTNPPVSRALQANFNKSVFNENLKVVSSNCWWSYRKNWIGSIIKKIVLEKSKARSSFRHTDSPLTLDGFSSVSHHGPTEL